MNLSKLSAALRKPRRVRWKPLLLVSCAPLAGLLLYSVWPVNIAREYGVPSPPLPSPNAYDLYLQSARSIKSEPIDASLDPRAPREKAQHEARYPNGPRDAWRQRNAAGFARFQDALRADYRHPPVRRESVDDIPEEMADLRWLARYKATESRAFGARGDANSAVNSALDGFEMGVDLPHGAPMIETLGGMTAEAIALDALDGEIAHLNGAQAQVAARRMESLLARRVAWPDVLREEKYAGLASQRAHYAQAIKDAQEPPLFADPDAPAPTLPLSTRLLNASGNFLTRRLLNEYASAMDTMIANAARPYGQDSAPPSGGFFNPALPALLNAAHGTRFFHARGETSGNLALTRLALHAWRKDSGFYPDSLQALVPRYLKAVPRDPFSNAPLRYRRLSKRYTLWSVGPDGRDDNARPIQRTITERFKSINDPIDAPYKVVTRISYVARRDSQGDIVANINR